MPQLSQAGQIYASQFFWLAIVFALIYFGVGRAMVPRIERTVDDRAARIASDLHAAEGARQAASDADDKHQSSLDDARGQAARSFAEAQEQAAAATASKLKESDADVEGRIDAAVGRIEAAKADALRGIEDATVEAAQLIVAKLSGVAVDRAAVENRVKAELHG